MMVLALLAGFAAIVLIDLKVLITAKQKLKTLAVYFLLIAFGLTIGILLTLNEPPESPSVIIQKIVDSVLMR